MPSYLVLRGNYGEKIDKAFGMTRQGVRWRFHHIFCEMYVSAYESIYMIEKSFGTSLREAAMQISRERFILRQRAKNSEFVDGDRVADKDQD